MRRLAGLGPKIALHEDDEWPPSREDLLRNAAGASALITLVTDRIDAELMDSAGESLQVVANYAVGYDNIDVDAAKARGVVVTNTPEVLTEATADMAFGLVLTASRRIVEADRWLRTEPEWIWGPRRFVGLDISAGATLGIVGFGRIGSAVARRAQAFGMRIIASDAYPIKDADALGVEQVEFDEVIRESDAITLHAPLLESTRHLIGAEQFRAMKPTAILVNAARGPLVDEAALVEALRSGEIAGAGLDVYEREPVLEPGLTELDNIVIVPHIASAGDATRVAMAHLAIDNVEAVLNGQTPPTPIT